VPRLGVFADLEDQLRAASGPRDAGVVDARHGRPRRGHRRPFDRETLRAVPRRIGVAGGAEKHTKRCAAAGSTS
jgi:hypothetical protein